MECEDYHIQIESTRIMPVPVHKGLSFALCFAVADSLGYCQALDIIIM